MGIPVSAVLRIQAGSRLLRWLRSDLVVGIGVGLLSARITLEVLAWLDPSVQFAAGPLLALDFGVFVAALLAVWARYVTRASEALQTERQRIARDLHDGVGFHLTTALSLAPDTSSEVRLALELAMVELHSVVHFVHSPSVPIATAMGTLRYRLQPVVERQGVQLVWDVDDDTPEDALVGISSYHFARIAQEAFSNVLRHSRATRMEVHLRYSWAFGAMSLEVTDNGCGVGNLASLPAAGAGSPWRGLPGMRRRADLIGGELTVTEVPGGGTCVRLVVPVAS